MLWIVGSFGLGCGGSDYQSIAMEPCQTLQARDPATVSADITLPILALVSHLRSFVGVVISGEAGKRDSSWLVRLQAPNTETVRTVASTGSTIEETENATSHSPVRNSPAASYVDAADLR